MTVVMTETMLTAMIFYNYSIIILFGCVRFRLIFSLIILMSQTNIEYFNSNLKLFVNNIIEFYPEYKETLDEYYKEILEKECCNDDKYIKRFMRKFSGMQNDISNKNTEIFSENICILKNIDFKEIWENEKTTDKNKDIIWDYLQTLYVIGETIISDSDKIKKLVENFKRVRDNEELESDDTENQEIFNMIKNLSEKQKQKQEDEPCENGGLNEDMLNNGLIGNLAKELAEDINIEDMNLGIDSEDGNINDIFSNIMSGDNPMKFMNLIQNVGQKIQTKLSDGNIDQSKLVEEAQNMMGMLGNNNPMLNNLFKNAKKEMEKGTLQPPKNTSHNNPTRDRLRKKLEERKNKKK